MAQMLKVAQLLLQVLAVITVSNAKALPRFSEYNAVADELGEAVDQQETLCSSTDSEVLSTGTATWISSLTLLRYEPSSVAASIIRSCNSNGDSALDQTELTTCVQKELAASVSDSCFLLLMRNLDENSDGAVNDDELIKLIKSVEGRRSQRRRDINDPNRDDRLTIRTNLVDVLTEARYSSEFSGDDVNSNSWKDLLRDSVSTESDESSTDSGSSNSWEDLLTDSGSYESDETSGDIDSSDSKKDLFRDSRSSESDEFSTDSGSSNSWEDLLNDSGSNESDETSSDSGSSDSRENLFRESDSGSSECREDLLRDSGSYESDETSSDSGSSDSREDLFRESDSGSSEFREDLF